MSKILGLLALLGILGAALTGCGSTPEPTDSPPTQTPWVVVVTATSQSGEVVEVGPSQTPKATSAVPTGAAKASPESAKASPAATKAATARTGTTAEPTAVPALATATEVPPDTESPLPTESPAATDTPEPGSLEYPAPELVEPPTRQFVAWRNGLVLKWEYAGELAEDEYYHLHLERRPQTETQPWWGDYVFLKDTEYVLEKDFLDPFHYSSEHGEAVVYWWVKVVRKTGEDENGKPVGMNLSMPSEERTLVLEPKPEGR